MRKVYAGTFRTALYYTKGLHDNLTIVDGVYIKFYNHIKTYKTY